MAAQARRWWLLAVAAVVIASVAVTVYVQTHSSDPYETFRRACLARSGTIVVLSTSARPQAMGGTLTHYTVGCRAAGGTVTGRLTTNHL